MWRALSLAAVIVVGSAASACSEDLPTSSCADAFDGVVAGEPGRDLTAAFTDCGSRADFLAAAEEHPEAINGDPSRFLDQACQGGDDADLPPACG